MTHSAREKDMCAYERARKKEFIKQINYIKSVIAKEKIRNDERIDRRFSV